MLRLWYMRMYIYYVMTIILFVHVHGLTNQQAKELVSLLASLIPSLVPRLSPGCLPLPLRAWVRGYLLASSLSRLWKVRSEIQNLLPP